MSFSKYQRNIDSHCIFNIVLIVIYQMYVYETIFYYILVGYSVFWKKIW